MLPLLLSAHLVFAAPPRTGNGPQNPFEEEDESELFKLDEELVTVASKYAQTLRKAPTIVSLVTSDDIRERGYRSVADVLRDQPGIYVWKSGEGRDMAAFRGIMSPDNNKILLMVDGVPWYDGVYTHACLDDFVPISNVRQIEIMKGPGSAIYGTNAFAGVVNVVTWSGRELDGGRVRWIVGSTGRSDLTATVGGIARTGGMDVSSTAYVHVLSQFGDGLDITPKGRHDILGQDAHAGISAGARVQIEGLDLQIHRLDYRQTYLVNEADDPFEHLGKDINSFGLYYHNTFFNGRYTIELSPNAALTPYGFVHRYDNPGSYYFLTGYTTTETEPGVFETELGVVTVETEKDTRRWGFGLDFEGRPGLDHVTVGGFGVENVSTVDKKDGRPGVLDVEYVDFDRVGTETGFQASGTLSNLFAYAQHTWTILPEMEIAAGGRFDMRIPTSTENDPNELMYKPTGTPRVALLLVPSEAFTAKVLYGWAFRSPCIREVLVRTTQTDENGNYLWANGADLLPEQIQTVEGEISWVFNEPLELRLDASYSRVHNEIDKVIPPNEYTNLPGSLSILGGEAELSADYGIVEFSGAFAITDARYSADAGRYRNRVQYEFPPTMTKGYVRVRPTQNVSGTLGAEVYSYRPRYEWAPDSGLEDGPWFGLVNVGVRVTEIGKQGRFEFDVGVRNLLDTPWGTGVYRDDVNETSGTDPKYPYEMEGESRSLVVAVEGKF